MTEVVRKTLISPTLRSLWTGYTEDEELIFDIERNMRKELKIRFFRERVRKMNDEDSRILDLRK